MRIQNLKVIIILAFSIALIFTVIVFPDLFFIYMMVLALLLSLNVFNKFLNIRVIWETRGKDFVLPNNEIIMGKMKYYSYLEQSHNYVYIDPGDLRPLSSFRDKIVGRLTRSFTSWFLLYSILVVMIAIVTNSLLWFSYLFSTQILNLIQNLILVSWIGLGSLVISVYLIAIIAVFSKPRPEELAGKLPYGRKGEHSLKDSIEFLRELQSDEDMKQVILIHKRTRIPEQLFFILRNTNDKFILAIGVITFGIFAILRC